MNKEKLILLEKVIEDKNPHGMGLDADKHISFHDGFVEGVMTMLEYMSRRYPSSYIDIQNEIFKEVSKDYETTKLRNV